MMRRIHTRAARVFTLGNSLGPVVAFAALISILMSPASGSAQGELPSSRAEMVREADVVALGECVSERVGRSDEGDLITTTVDVQLHRVFKGRVVPSLTVKTLGGTLEGESMTASHGASLAAGEQVLLFLKRSEFGAYYVVLGGEAGKVVVNHVPEEWIDARVSQGTLAELARLLNAEKGQR